MVSEAEIGLYTEGYLRWDQRLRLVSTMRATLDGIRGLDWSLH